MPWQNIGSPFVVISPTSGQILIYNGTPALGTLAASFIASQVPFPSIAGTDQYGNNYLGGETWYNNSFPYSYVNINQGIETFGFMSGAQPATFPANQFTAINAATWSPFGTGLQVSNFIDIHGPSSNVMDNLLMNSANGSLTYYSELDQAVYTLGKQWAFTPNITLNSTSPQVIASVNVDNPLVYHYKALLVCTTTANAGTFSIGWDGSATTSGVGKSLLLPGATSVSVALNTNGMPPLATSPTLASGTRYYYDAEGEFSVSSSGVLSLRGQVSNAADTVTVINGSYFYVEPMN